MYDSFLRLIFTVCHPFKKPCLEKDLAAKAGRTAPPKI